jgi:hypothetical protein
MLDLDKREELKNSVLDLGWNELNDRIKVQSKQLNRNILSKPKIDRQLCELKRKGRADFLQMVRDQAESTIDTHRNTSIKELDKPTKLTIKHKQSFEISSNRDLFVYKFE